MIYNYTPGVTEILTLESIGQNNGTNTVIKVDGYFTNIFSDLTLYTDAAGTSQVPIDAYAQTSIDQTVTNLEVGKTNKTAYKTYIVTNPTYQNVDLWATFTNFGTYTDNGAVAPVVTRGLLENGAQLTDGRIAFQETTSGTLTTSGWYKVALALGAATVPYNATFKFSALGPGRADTITIEVLGGGGGSALKELQISITGRGSFSSASHGIKGARLGYSPSVSSSGQNLELNIDHGTSVILQSMIISNTAVQTYAGFSLIEPIISDGLLPDGVTPATFIEAGAELSFEGSNYDFIPNFTALKFSNDSLLCTVLWPEIPKQGTGITLTPASTNTIFIDGNGTSVGLSSFTISSFSQSGYYVRFLINQIGIGTALNAGASSLRINGTGAKLTITG